jgi:hypothetical protein
MELNGIANMKLIIEMALEDKKIDEETADKLDEQLNILMDYMKMYRDATKAKWTIKAWHEVREEYHARKNNY